MKKSVLIFSFILFFTGQMLAQVTVKGLVKDKSGAPLPGVNIVIKGTTQGTVTDGNGNYIISEVPADATLVFSFLGMATQEIAVGNQTQIKVTMVEEATSLDQVVVVGYGGVKRANLLGSVVDISTEEFENIPSANLSTLLEGRLAGVRVGQSSGKPGAATGISIRTSTSWNREEPIFVIDGFIQDQEAFDNLDPSEVESISILKDASAAVYGARAAGGVILITTKKGKEGKPELSYSGSYGFSDATMFPEMLSARDHAVLVNDALKTIYPASYEFQAAYYTDDELEHFDTTNYNWLEEAWQSSYITRHRVNVSGGTEKIRYFGGGTYYYETGNFDNLYVEKYTLRLGVEANITRDLKASFGLSTDTRKDERPYNTSDTEPDPLRNTFKSLLETPRWIPPYINGLPVGQLGTVTSHPLEIMRINSYSRNRGTNYNLNTALEYSIPFIKGLRLRLAYAYNEGNSYNKQYRLDYRLYNFYATGGHRHILTDEVYVDPYVIIDNKERIMEGYDHDRRYQFNASIYYDKQIGLHNINALMVYEQAESEGNSFDALREDLIVEKYERQEGFSEAMDGTRSGASAGGRLSYIGRLNYNYAEKYLIETAFRYEGSVKFPPESRWGFFPSIALGWRISEEPFFKDNIHFVDYLKLRVSAGLVGNDGIGVRQWEQSYSTTGGAFLGGADLTNALQPRNDGIITTGVTWEKSESYNAGFDLRLFRNISLGFDAFYRHTYDILSERKSILPTSTGINKMPSENYGRMEAWGSEIEAGYDGIIYKDLRFYVRCNFSFARSRVLEKYQNPAVIGTWKDEIGKMPNGEVGYFSTGIIRTQAEADSLQASGWTIFGMDPEPGMVNYKDVGSADYSDSLDGKIDGNDKRIIEPFASPPYVYGFTLGLSWRNLRLDANFKGEFGRKVFLEKEAFQLPEEEGEIDEYGENLLAFWKDHWTEDNPDAAYPRVFNNAAHERSTFWIRDGHVLRLSSINLSYNLPEKLSSRLNIPELQILITGRNLWTLINPYDYKDPDISKFNGYPLMRSINFGLKITL